MSRFKPILKSLDDAVKVGKKAPLADANRPAGDLGLLDNLDEYERVAGELEKANDVPPTPKAVQQEIVQRRAVEAETVRQQRIFDPKSEVVDYSKQSQNSEEFKRRLDEQLEDPEFASRASTPDEIPNLADDINHAQIEDLAFQEDMKTVQFRARDARFESRLASITEDSPYGDRVFITIDRQSDPVRGQEGFVQFEGQPRELGKHSGTNRAAIQATIKSEESGMQVMDTLDDLVEQVAIASNLGVPNVRRMVFNALDEHFFLQFTEGKYSTAPAWDDVGVRLTNALENQGFPGGEVHRALAMISEMPTASSTPHYFLGKNGLLMNDAAGNWFSPTVGKQLQRIFPDSFDEIEAAMSVRRGERMEKLQQFIESKGYDHVVYHNMAEDRGTLSVINWNEDLMVPLYDARLTGGNTRVASGSAASFVMGSLGLGAGNAAVRDKQ